MGGADPSAPLVRAPALNGGDGGRALAASILEQRQYIRTNVDSIIKTMEDHGARGIPISADLAEAIPLIARELLSHESLRIRRVGAFLVMAALKHNLKVFEFADRAARLDSGEATETVRHEHNVRYIRGVSEGDI